jgi:predicted nucleic acid-binding protein
VKILLDTNIYFAVIYEPGYLERHQRVLVRTGPSMYLSSVVRFELLQGARGETGRAKVNRATRHLERTGRVVTPSHEDWIRAGTVQGRLWDDHPDLRTKNLENDILVAGTARRIGALLITENTADFDLIRSLIPHHAASMDEVASSLGA